MENQGVSPGHFSLTQKNKDVSPNLLNTSLVQRVVLRNSATLLDDINNMYVYNNNNNRVFYGGHMCLS